MFRRAALAAVLGCAWSVWAETVSLEGAMVPRGPAERLETARTKLGRDALAWEPDLAPLARPAARVDLARYRTLRFWLHSDAATFARIKLTAGESFSLTFAVDWTGWARFELPEWRFQGFALRAD
jgi:hypothetical protein